MSEKEGSPVTFEPVADHLLRALLLTVILTVLVVVGAGWILSGSSYVRETHLILPQPIPFSHEHHVAEIGIDCRYCHDGAARSAQAGLPDSALCLNCHSQLYSDEEMLEPLRVSVRRKEPLAWNRVTELPDHVVFNHSAHVQQGVSCFECHGEVQEMPMTWKAKDMTMRWCLECHRAPESRLRPREFVTDPYWEPPENRNELGEFLVREYGIDKPHLTDCGVCHR